MTPYSPTPFNEYIPLIPPRPKSAIHPIGLRSFEWRGWIAQPKLNGDYNIVGVTPERNLIASTRQHRAHTRWQFDEASGAAFKEIPGKKWYVICCELMNNKTPHLKNINYIHDIMVANGQRLDGMTYPQRHALLLGIFPPQGKTSEGHYIINDNLWLADIYSKDFQMLFHTLTYSPECEGLVLKNVATRLSFADTSKGMVKCRRSTKSYNF